MDIKKIKFQNFLTFGTQELTLNENDKIYNFRSIPGIYKALLFFDGELKISDQLNTESFVEVEYTSGKQNRVKTVKRLVGKEETPRQPNIIFAEFRVENMPDSQYDTLLDVGGKAYSTNLLCNAIQTFESTVWQQNDEFKQNVSTESRFRRRIKTQFQRKNSEHATSALDIWHQIGDFSIIPEIEKQKFFSGQAMIERITYDYSTIIRDQLEILNRTVPSLLDSQRAQKQKDNAAKSPNQFVDHFLILQHEENVTREKYEFYETAMNSEIVLAKYLSSLHSDEFDERVKQGNIAINNDREHKRKIEEMITNCNDEIKEIEAGIGNEKQTLDNFNARSNLGFFNETAQICIVKIICYFNMQYTAFLGAIRILPDFIQLQNHIVSEFPILKDKICTIFEAIKLNFEQLDDRRAIMFLSDYTYQMGVPSNIEILIQPIVDVLFFRTSQIAYDVGKAHIFGKFDGKICGLDTFASTLPDNINDIQTGQISAIFRDKMKQNENNNIEIYNYSEKTNYYLLKILVALKQSYSIIVSYYTKGKNAKSDMINNMETYQITLLKINEVHTLFGNAIKKINELKLRKAYLGAKVALSKCEIQKTNCNILANEKLLSSTFKHFSESEKLAIDEQFFTLQIIYEKPIQDMPFNNIVDIDRDLENLYHSDLHIWQHIPTIEAFQRSVVETIQSVKLQDETTFNTLRNWCCNDQKHLGYMDALSRNITNGVYNDGKLMRDITLLKYPFVRQQDLEGILSSSSDRNAAEFYDKMRRYHSLVNASFPNHYFKRKFEAIITHTTNFLNGVCSELSAGDGAGRNYNFEIQIILPFITSDFNLIPMPNDRTMCPTKIYLYENGERINTKMYIELLNVAYYVFYTFEFTDSIIMLHNLLKNFSNSIIGTIEKYLKDLKLDRCILIV